MPSIPYEMPPKSGLVCENSARTVFPLKYASRAFISKIVILQVSGTLDFFTVEFFNNRMVLTGTSESDDVGPDKGNIPEECFLVGPPLTSGEAGKLMYFSDQATGGHGLTFMNTDPKVRGGGREGRQEDTIYVRITPHTPGGGRKVFCVALGGETIGVG